MLWIILDVAVGLMLGLLALGPPEAAAAATLPLSAVIQAVPADQAGKVHKADGADQADRVDGADRADEGAAARLYPAFASALFAQWYLPGSRHFVARTLALRQALAGWCADASTLPAARAQWREALDAWSTFSAVRGGALLARRSPREIDFQPLRPAAVERAIAAHAAHATQLDPTVQGDPPARSAQAADPAQAAHLPPATAAAAMAASMPSAARGLAATGAPAKGLPALEWLLWARPHDVAGCRYAVDVAAAVHQEALALQQAYQRSLDAGWDAQEAEYALYEFLNLWDAGLQKLWWEEIDRPVQKARSQGRRPEAVLFSRALSGHTLRSWQLQWQALRRLALAPEPFSLASLLLARGRAAELAGLQQAVARLDQAMAALAATARVADARVADPPVLAQDPAALAEAVDAAKALQQFVETDLAAALNFVISFFDEDGD